VAPIKRRYKLCKGRQKGRQKGQPIAALFNCVFLDTKKEKKWLIIYLYSLL
jgi:hypothetical protein